MTRKTNYFSAQGGENLNQSALSIAPGELLYSENYEPDTLGKYRRIDGFERFDGRGKPSEASYWRLDFDAGTVAVSEGDVVTGATSGASGKALIDAVVESGSYGGADAVGYLILTDVTGIFQNDENLQVSAATRMVMDGVAVQRGATNDTDDATWIQDAIETRRALIAAVPGSGPIRGVWTLNGVAYCVRDNAGATAGILHKESTSGWAAQDLGSVVPFTAGTAEFLEGETLTGGTSGATATILRVILESGTWGSTAAGRLIVGPITSGPYQAETGTSASGSATIAAETANALSPGGRYEFENENFFGSAGTTRMYFVNGLDEFIAEYDGDTFVPIPTGITGTAPTHVTTHANHLFCSYPEGSVNHSKPGEPYLFTGATAGEIAVGDAPTGFLSLPGGILGIWTRSQTRILYGSANSGADAWDLKRFSRLTGAIEWTIQSLPGTPVFIDDQGFTTLTSTAAFGDFNSNTFSQKIQPLVDARKTRIVSSLRSRTKNHYRVFYDDNVSITVGFSPGGGITGFLRQNLGMVVRCACSGEDANGNEMLLVGSDDGFIYEMDKGTSFDGQPVQAYLRFAFNHVNSPQNRKRFFKVALEMDAPDDPAIQFTPDFSYADPSNPTPETEAFSTQSGGGYWDISTYGQFQWSSAVVAEGQVYISGTGRNIGILLYSSNTYERPHTIQGYQLHYAVRGLAR